MYVLVGGDGGGCVSQFPTIFPIGIEVRSAKLTPTIVGDRIRSKQRELNLTPIELADRLGVHHTTLAKWEMGTDYPSADSMALCRSTLAGLGSFCSLKGVAVQRLSEHNRYGKYHPFNLLCHHIVRQLKSPGRRRRSSLHIREALLDQGGSIRRNQVTLHYFAGIGMPGILTKNVPMLHA